MTRQPGRLASSSRCRSFSHVDEPRKQPSATRYLDAYVDDNLAFSRSSLSPNPIGTFSPRESSCTAPNTTSSVASNTRRNSTGRSPSSPPFVPLREAGTCMTNDSLEFPEDRLVETSESLLVSRPSFVKPTASSRLDSPTAEFGSSRPSVGSYAPTRTSSISLPPTRTPSIYAQSVTVPRRPSQTRAATSGRSPKFVAQLKSVSVLQSISPHKSRDVTPTRAATRSVTPQRSASHSAKYSVVPREASPSPSPPAIRQTVTMPTYNGPTVIPICGPNGRTFVSASFGDALPPPSPTDIATEQLLSHFERMGYERLESGGDRRRHRGRSSRPSARDLNFRQFTPPPVVLAPIPVDLQAPPSLPVYYPAPVYPVASPGFSPVPYREYSAYPMMPQPMWPPEPPALAPRFDFRGRLIHDARWRPREASTGTCNYDDDEDSYDDINSYEDANLGNGRRDRGGHLFPDWRDDLSKGHRRRKQRPDPGCGLCC